MNTEQGKGRGGRQATEADNQDEDTLLQGLEMKVARLVRASKISKGVIGVTAETSRGFYIIYIESNVEGRGDVGRYLDAVIDKYKVVKVPNVLSPRLDGMLKRRGFAVKREFVPELKATVDVHIYRK